VSDSRPLALIEFPADDPERALQMFGAVEFGQKIDPGMY